MSRLCTDCTHCKFQFGKAFPMKLGHMNQKDIGPYLTKSGKKLARDFNFLWYTLYHVDNTNIRCTKGKWINCRKKEYRFKQLDHLLKTTNPRSMAMKYKRMAETCEHYDGEE